MFSSPIKLSLSTLLLLCLLSAADAQTTTWLGGDGNWDDNSNWSNGIPSSGVTALIDSGNSTNSSVIIDASFGDAFSLAIDLNDQLTILDRRLEIFSSFENNGLLEIGGSQSGSRLSISGDSDLSGGGTIRLSNPNSELLIFSGQNYGLTNLGNTIIGKGEVRAFQFDGPGLINQGSIIADDPQDPLIIKAAIDNTGGEIRATGNSNLYLDADTTILGGTIITDQGSSVIIDDEIAISDVELDGSIQVAPGRNTELELSGDISNLGLITHQLDNDFSTAINMVSPTTLTGQGVIELQYLRGINVDVWGTQWVNIDNLIRGNGFVVGIDNRPDGIVRADIPLVDDGRALTLYSLITNTGLFVAESGCELAFDDEASIDNTGGTILAKPMGNVSINALNLLGGTIIGEEGSNLVVASTLEDVTIRGEIDYTIAAFSGTINNEGVINGAARLNSVRGNLRYVGDLVLTGGGVVNTSDSGGFTPPFANSFVNVDNTITGSFSIWAKSSVDFQADTVLSPGIIFPPFNSSRGGIFISSDDIQFNGRIILDLTSPGTDLEDINLGNEHIRAVNDASTRVGGTLEFRFSDDMESLPEIGDFYDPFTGRNLSVEEDMVLELPAGYSCSYEIVTFPDGPVLTQDVIRFTFDEVPTRLVVVPDNLTVNRGVLSSGQVGDLSGSDNDDVSIQRNPIATQAVIELEVTGTCPVTDPSALQLRFEGSVFARSPVVVEMQVFNYETQQFDLYDSFTASRFTDAIETRWLRENLAAYIQANTGEMKVRFKLSGSTNRQAYATNIDQIVWLVEE